MGKPANASADCSINNIYRLEGRVPIGKAIPFGLQHILAMFVSNLAPITIIAGAAQPALSQAQVAILLQNAMFVAGIATLIQLYPIWYHHTGYLPAVEHFCKRLLKTAFCSGRTCCRLCDFHFCRKGRFKSDYVRRSDFSAPPASLYSGIPSGCHSFCLHYLPGICSRNHR